METARQKAEAEAAVERRELSEMERSPLSRVILTLTLTLTLTVTLTLIPTGRLFGRMDEDGDGVVSFAEFSGACGRDAELCLHMTKGVFGKAGKPNPNSNPNPNPNPNPDRNWKAGKPHLSKKEVNRVWQLIDTDLDDYLTREELLAWWTARALDLETLEAGP